MYMAGNSISIFPIMMVGMMFLRPVKALLAIKSSEWSMNARLEALSGEISTWDMASKQWHRTAEMATNDTKIGWKCDSDREKRKY